MNWLRGKKPKGLADLTYDELRLEKVKLEATEQKRVRELQDLNRQIDQLFEEAKKETSPAVQQVKARQIRDINHRLVMCQSNMARLGKLIQIVDLTMAHKELGQESPFGDIISQTDSLAIGDWVDDVVSVSTVMDQKLDQIITAFGQAKLVQTGVATGDAEIDAILAEIQIGAAADAMAAEAQISAKKEKPLGKFEND